MVKCSILRANQSELMISAHDIADEEHHKIYDSIASKVRECNRKQKRIRDIVRQRTIEKKD